ncbi:hypothetical protein IM774_02935 [Erysipelotrichaceae bacterium RD49]|nr:hypothetical protein [Erysipelotrichaceae bacterium RD49]
MNAPTLIVGLGGTGCKIAERVSQMVIPSQRDSIAFCGFDTDINDLQKISDRNPLIHLVQTSTRQTVGEYLSLDQYSKDEWFPGHAILYTKPLTEGAGQVRAISRLSLNPVVRAGQLEPLHEAIQSLYKVDQTQGDQALRVIIVSSLAGGTGSGLILPIALYIRQYLKTHYRQNANITRGFFILPEIFYEVITDRAERNNLSANAYATLRELDAFLMKGDNSLPSRYKDSVRLLMPRISAEGYEDFNVRPYDFCFLFDAQNAEGSKLNSFEQYLDHAANCIYSQSIGPMNKRSNSSEDNTIRRLAQESGRNRYAGAGASRLEYPLEDIKTLVALNWMREAISEQWLVYDRLFKAQKAEANKRREEGLSMTDQSFEEFYREQIKTDVDNKKKFARAIFTSTGDYEDGINRKADHWNQYLEQITSKVNAESTDLSPRSRQASEACENLLNTLSEKSEWADFADTWHQLDTYRKSLEKDVEDKAANIAYSTFLGVKEEADGSFSNLQLEYYLTDQKGNFIHPCASRYMIAKVLEELENRRTMAKNRAEELEDIFKSRETDGFEDDKGERLTVNTIGGYQGAGRFKRKADKRLKNEILDDLTTYKQEADEWVSNKIQAEVYMAGLQYYHELFTAYDNLFQALESKVGQLDKRIEQLKNKYVQSSGSTVRYVCANRKCLEAILKKMPYLQSRFFLDKNLARKIHQRVRDFSMMSERPEAAKYFGGLFDQEMTDFYKAAVMDSYGLELSVDILTAIEKEAELLGLYKDDPDSLRLTDQYVRDVIRTTRALSCPFIETPLGETKAPVNSCAYNTSLIPPKGDDSLRSRLVQSELANLGGTPDDDIPENMIMFYKSFYGLRANELSKFAPPIHDETHDRPAGEYFKAYYELVDSLLPIPGKSSGISPHLDKWWHLVTKMPDLDEGNQEKQFHEQFAAFFWAMLIGLINLDQVSDDQQNYKINIARLRLKNDSRFKYNGETLVVSNGTPCDKLYEVLDAISIYPALTHRILEYVNNEIAYDINMNGDLNDRLLWENLRTFKIEEPLIGRNREKSTCVLDLPLLLRKSNNTKSYFEEDSIGLLKVILDELKRYFELNINEKDALNDYLAFIKHEYARSLVSWEKEEQAVAQTLTGSLFNNWFETIAQYFEDLGARRDAKEIRKKAEALKAAYDPQLAQSDGDA